MFFFSDTNTQRLFLTPYIENNELEKGRALAKVTQLEWNVTSYAGLFTVNKTCDSNMFFWYFPAERNQDKVPLIIWLNGFSTASSYGIFLQNGPFSLLEGSDLVPRSTSWQKYFNVIYIDNPVGVGFSYAKEEENCYSKTLSDVSMNLHHTMEQFYKLFPDLLARELYVTGLSLGGKYVSSIAYRIFKQKSFNMKGVFLGNPLLDPEIQLNHGQYLYELGFVDKNQMGEVTGAGNKIIQSLKNKQYDEAYKDVYEYLLYDNNFITNMTGIDSVFNYAFPYVNTKYYDSYIRNENVRRAVHVGDLEYSDGATAMSKAGVLFSVPVTDFLGEMVEEVDLLFYAGQLDVSLAYPMLVDVLSSVNWTGKDGYMNAERVKLYDESSNHVWGYSRNYKTLTDVMVRNASHTAVTDRPDQILGLLLNFTNYVRFS